MSGFESKLVKFDSIKIILVLNSTQGYYIFFSLISIWDNSIWHVDLNSVRLDIVKKKNYLINKTILFK